MAQGRFTQLNGYLAILIKPLKLGHVNERCQECRVLTTLAPSLLNPSKDAGPRTTASEPNAGVTGHISERAAE